LVHIMLLAVFLLGVGRGSLSWDSCFFTNLFPSSRETRIVALSFREMVVHLLTIWNVYPTENHRLKLVILSLSMPQREELVLYYASGQMLLVPLSLELFQPKKKQVKLKKMDATT